MNVKANPLLFLFSLVFTSSLSLLVCLGMTTITGNQFLSGDKTITSPGGVFELGFFKPSNSSNYYIGIWYKNVYQKTIVWVANRDKPISDTNTSALRISDGNLVLFNEAGLSIWSTDLRPNFTSSSLEAVLEDTGNLLLRSGSTSSESLWQSFDRLTDTWLPDSKIGINKVTNKATILTSWRNEEDPSPGMFSLGLNRVQTHQIVLWNMSQQLLIFGDLDDWRLNDFFYFTYINNEKESYFSYTTYDKSTMHHLVVNDRGLLQLLKWSGASQEWIPLLSVPEMQCELYGYCGAFGICTIETRPPCQCLRGFVPNFPNDWKDGNYSGGCIRKTSLVCGDRGLGNVTSDRFFIGYYTFESGRTPQWTIAAETSQECESFCLKNCSCIGFIYDNFQCQFYYGDILNLQKFATLNNYMTLYIRLAASEFFSSQNRSPGEKNKLLIAGILASLAMILLLGAMTFLILRQTTRRRIVMQNAMEGSLMVFGYKALQTATKNFSMKLGGGSFGSVFAGILPDSSAIAVKRLEHISQGEKEFRAEVRTIGSLQHVNLIRLCGFCCQGVKRLLVYDYMPNGSLSSHLFQEEVSNVLDWKTRFGIALGTARGLAYLHENCRERIIHCDIKPDNILLDAQFCPKVADFGLAKLLARDFSRVLTTVRGTIGYIAPEWISGLAITSKADVYSYGMMLLEIISGRRNSEQHRDHKSAIRYFPIRMASVLNEDIGDALSLLDCRLAGHADVEELTRACKVACWCIQDDEAHRPSMGQVVHILEGTLDVNVPPVPSLLLKMADDGDNSLTSLC